MGEQGACLGHIPPFGESLAPPLIVFRDRVVLREIEGDGLGQGHGDVAFTESLNPSSVMLVGETIGMEQILKLV